MTARTDGTPVRRTARPEGSDAMLFRKKAAPAKGEDRRLAPRRMVRLEAEIRLAGGRSLTCTTVDMSTSGARVTLRGGILLPETFDVAIPRGEAGWRRARLVWRSGETVGLQYV